MSTTTTDSAPVTTAFDVSDRTQIEVTGSDRAQFLHNFTSNDIKRLKPGSGCETFITNIKGKVVAHVFVFCTEKSLWLDGTTGQEAAITGHLGKYLLVDDVQLVPRAADRGELYLSGNGAVELLKLKSALAVATHQGKINGIDADIRRVDLLNETGFLISVSKADTESVRTSLVAAGAKEGSAELFEALRIQAGFPVYGIDITDDNLAQEVGRTSQCVSSNKGCYLGQETIARLDSMGHTNQELRRIRFVSSELPVAGTPLFDESIANQVGIITSAAYQMGDPANSETVVNAIGLVKRSSYQAGTKVAFVHGHVPVIGVVL